jgi:hypothetical protein
MSVRFDEGEKGMMRRHRLAVLGVAASGILGMATACGSGFGAANCEGGLRVELDAAGSVSPMEGLTTIATADLPPLESGVDSLWRPRSSVPTPR